MTIPYGSSLNDPRLRNALSGLAEQAQAAAQLPVQQPVASAHPHGSTLNDAGLAGRLNMMGELAARSEPAVGMCVLKNALNGGELSPDMEARFDLPRYQLGCESMLNMVPLAGGGLTKRPGFRFVTGTGAETGVGALLLPFAYSSSVKLMLMFLGNAGGGQVYILDRDGQAGATPGPVVPYGRDELAQLCWEQSGKNIYLAHPNHPPAKLVFDGSAFAYKALDFSNRVPVPGIINLEIVGIPNEAWGWRHYKVTAVSDETGEESYPSEVKSLRTSSLNTSFMCQITIQPVPGCSEYRVYKQRGGEFGFIGRITDGSNQFRDQGYDPDVSDTPPREQKFFDGPGNYPAVVFLHQQRLGWAATNNDPLTIWMSQTSNYECLASKTPPLDDDGIETTLASTQANRILWAVSDRNGLALGTEGEEWYLTGAAGEGAAVTPNSLSFQPQTKYGTQYGIQPVRANSSLLFVQRGGRIIRDLGYSYQTDRYEAQDLTLLARHIFQYNPIRSWCWQGSPHNILWCVVGNGKLAALTYLPENEVTAWHRHVTVGHVLSCAALDDSQGRARLWIVADRPEGVHVEIMDNFIESGVPAWDEQEPDPREYQHVDGQARHPITAHFIPCLPEAGMENASSSMRLKKINSITCRVINSWPFSWQITDQHNRKSREAPIPIRRKPPDQNGSFPAENFAAAADWNCPIDSGFRENPKARFNCDGPYPLTILGITVATEVARDAGSQDGR